MDLSDREGHGTERGHTRAENPQGARQQHSTPAGHGLRARVALAGIAFLSVALLAQARLPTGPEDLFERTLRDTAHLPLFGLAAALWLSLARFGRGELRRLDLLALLAWVVLLAAGTEWVQRGTSRDASMGDFARDLAGAGTLTLLWIAIRPGALLPHRGRSGWRVSALLAAIATLTMAVVPLVRAFRAPALRDASLPRLVDFDRDWIRRFADTRDARFTLVPAPPELGDSTRSRVGRIDFGRSDYPAWILRELSEDWSPYRRLEIDLYLAGQEGYPLVVRAEDQAHEGAWSDRFHRTVTLRPGHNHLVVELRDLRQAPAKREMDLRHMRSLTLFGDRPPAARTLYLLDLRLSGSTGPHAPEG